jgi:hypothetical protein
MLDVDDHVSCKDISFEKNASFVFYCGQSINLSLETFPLECEYFNAALVKRDSFKELATFLESKKCRPLTFLP